jgi:hypothetical protein
VQAKMIRKQTKYENHQKKINSNLNRETKIVMDHKLCQKNDQIAYGRALHKRETGRHATANWLYWEITALWFAILKKLKKYELFISVR